VTFEGCSFERNIANRGGGVCVWSSGTGGRGALRGCRIIENSAGKGGGIYNRHLCDIVDCEIAGNRATDGGGLSIEGGGNLWSSRIAGNWADGRGGGMLFITNDIPMANLVIYGNRASDGSAIQYMGREGRLLHSTIALNRSDAAGGMALSCDDAVVSLESCIVWANSPVSACGTPASSIVDRDPLFASTGQIDFDRVREITVSGETVTVPDFIVVEPDLDLLEGSPAIDIGRPGSAPDRDVRGNLRPCGRGPDAGAYEAMGCPLVPFIRGDADSSGKIDISDPIVVLSFLFLGGAAPSCLDAADVDDSEIIELTDAIFALSFLFLGGLPPAPPFPACGTEERMDWLTCLAAGACR
jgi:hypothetical protein